MIFSKVALAAAAMMATTVFAKGTQPGSSIKCGTPPMTPQQVHNYNTLASQSMNKLNALKASAQKSGGSSIQKVEIEDLQEKEVKVYVHVLANGTEPEEGYLDVCRKSPQHSPSRHVYTHKSSPTFPFC